MKFYRLAVGVAVVILLFVLGTRSSGQQPAATSNQTPAGTVASAAATPRPVVAATRPPTAAQFDAVLKPLMESTCLQCHNETDAEAGFVISRYASVESLSEDRDQWDTILMKLKSGDMPPPDVEYPEKEIQALVGFLEAEFKRADANVKPDPGRVTARRLNRAEYTNTIRDLFGVEFRADQHFPADDLGAGFDNIGDVLTVSPLLMESYIAAAAEIAERALGTQRLPALPLDANFGVSPDYRGPERVRPPNFKKLRQVAGAAVDPSDVELVHRVEFDGDYRLVLGLEGQRPPGAKPVTLGVWLDGQLVQTKLVETTASDLTYFRPLSLEELRLPLTTGEHTLRFAFIDDAYLKTMKKEEIYGNDRTNKWVGTVQIIGPFAPAAPPPSRARILTCDPETGSSCINRILAGVARRAYRRPVSSSEVATLARFVTLAKSKGETTEQGIQLAIQAMLVSPNFLFHLERDLYPNDPTRVHRISDVELASRLSYFLWNSMPDDELLGLAERRQLNRPAVLEAEVRRMLIDPKAFALSENFAGQWLELRNLVTKKPDPDKFPAWTPELREAMRRETLMFFDSMLRENRPIGEFITARYTFLNELLARYYGIDGVTGPEFRRVELTTDQRGGVLTHGSVLAVSSYPTRTSVVIRGKYILQNILGTPPPPPPANVPALDEEAVGTAASLRQQMEKHRTNAVCASCHSRMDPLGFGLENYDAIGKWRTHDGTFPIDSRGVLPSGKSFSTPAEMRDVLGGMLPDVSRSLTEKMLTYSLGRGLERYDRSAVQAVTAELAKSGYGLQTLVLEVVKSLPFQSRRAEVPRNLSASR